MRLFTLPGILVLTAVGLSAQVQESRPLVSRGVPLDLVCGPQAALTKPVQSLRVMAGTERVKALFGPGETVIINGGTSQGVRSGQTFYVRRIIDDRFIVKTHEAPPTSIHTAGWITVLEAQADVSVATVTEACDGVVEGDFLEPLVLPPAVAATPGGEPDYARPARVIMADDRRQLGAEGSLMILDRGSDHGLRPGQRLTIYRQAVNGSGPIVKMGDAFVASTRPDTSVMRIERSREAVQVGDLIAIHR